MTVDTTLAEFQSRFVASLLRAEALPGEGLAGQPGFAVYRNTIRRGAIDALEANYPSIVTLVGSDWLRAAAAIYVESHWPTQPVLLDYGDGFAGFLAGFAPAAPMPWLPAVAALDRLWTESHLAADAQVLTVRSATAFGEALFGSAVRPHPAARWRWFEAQPAHAIWSHSRRGAAVPNELAWAGDGALLTRPVGAVHSQPLSRAGCALLDACAKGVPLGEAIASFEAAAVDGVALVHQLIVAGAFAAPGDARQGGR